MAHPRGIITHWLAGNVPILGMISLIQGIITKNTNLLVYKPGGKGGKIDKAQSMEIPTVTLDDFQKWALNP